MIGVEGGLQSTGSPPSLPQNGSFVLEDRFATGYAVPVLDRTQVRSRAVVVGVMFLGERAAPDCPVLFTFTTQNKELLYASRAYSVRASGDKKTEKRGEGGGAIESGASTVTTAFIFRVSAAANCEVCRRAHIRVKMRADHTCARSPSSPIHQDDHGEDTGIVPGRNTFVMWAHGQEEEAGGMGPTYHGPRDRGASEVDFLLPSREALLRATGPVSPPVEGSNKRGQDDAARTLRVALPGVRVPERRTTYMCM